VVVEVAVDVLVAGIGSLLPAGPVIAASVA